MDHSGVPALMDMLVAELVVQVMHDVIFYYILYIILFYVLLIGREMFRFGIVWEFLLDSENLIIYGFIYDHCSFTQIPNFLYMDRQTLEFFVKFWES